MYIPKSLWSTIKGKLVEEMASIKMGPVQDFSNFMNAVIDKKAFDKTMSYIGNVKSSAEAEIIAGGNGDDSSGYFIEPTLIVTTNPSYETMVEEIFAPVLTAYIYEDNQFSETLKLCDETGIYALTGCIWSQDRYAIVEAVDALRQSAGNFYINDKPTGAVVGQQPFGGGRGSGTNDKAGSLLNLQRWVSTRTIKETFVPPTDYRYPHMD